MAFIGQKQTVSTGVDIGTAAGQVMGYVTGTAGARGILLRVRGGTNAANNLVLVTLRCCASTALAATAATAAQLALILTAGALGKTNGTTETGLQLFYTLDTSLSSTVGPFPIPTPVVQVVMQMATAASGSTGTTVVEAWPIYDTDPKGGGNSMTLDGV